MAKTHVSPILPSAVQSQLNFSFADWTKLVLFSINPATHPPTRPPTRPGKFVSPDSDKVENWNLVHNINKQFISMVNSRLYTEFQSSTVTGSGQINFPVRVGWLD